ncbi:MAG: hypothetical protein QOH93_1662 [Chloroflexia bacterium]|nr:hypothetical protein [Chloroflexia bacterium]
MSPRLKRIDYVKAATSTCGVQAQVMSAAELAVGVRVDGLTAQDVQSALWQDRTLVKTWAMRGTLHLLAATDLPLFVAARDARDRNWLKYFTYYGISEAQYKAFLVAVPQILGSEPMTREQLAKAVAKDIGAPELGEQLVASSWGSLWKPSAWRGDLCFGPNLGRNVTFVRPTAWCGGEWQPLEPQEALKEIARHYLRAYGPANPQDFARWWSGTGVTPARKLFQSIEDELEPVDVEGWRAYALRSTLEPMQQIEPTQTIRLLPLFDAYVLGLAYSIGYLLPKAHKSRVFRIAGWITAVVLVDGRIEGVWDYKTGGGQTVVTVTMFSPPSAGVRQGIETEAQRLNAFLDTAQFVFIMDVQAGPPPPR